MQKRHSRTAIASFATTMAAGLMSLALFAVMALNSEKVNKGGAYADDSKVLYGLAGVIIAGMFIMAAGLAIAGAVQRSGKKDFAVVSLCVLAGYLALFLLLALQ